MKISNSKKELARIISENGGWRAGAESAAQCKSDNAVSFYRDVPDRDGDCWWGEHLDRLDISQDKLIANWHQSCLSRDEYFHLYPAPDAELEFCESVMRSIPEPEAKPTIEQLAADYRNAKDYAERKQQEADDAKADEDEKLRVLEIAGEALGLLVSPITTKQDPELVISDWRDLQVGDEVEARCQAGVLIGLITEMEPKDYDGERPFRFRPFGENTRWCTSSKFKFIRRQ